jgi:hypothetical protein
MRPGRAAVDFRHHEPESTRVAPYDEAGSPGNTANLMLMRALAERGFRAYDFLRGTSGHKQR